jgi:hypothetical protein
VGAGGVVGATVGAAGDVGLGGDVGVGLGGGVGGATAPLVVGDGAGGAAPLGLGGAVGDAGAAVAEALGAAAESFLAGARRGVIPGSESPLSAVRVSPAGVPTVVAGSTVAAGGRALGKAAVVVSPAPGPAMKYQAAAPPAMKTPPRPSTTISASDPRDDGTGDVTTG